MSCEEVSASRPLLIMQTGSASLHIRQKHGDYDRMFIRMTGLESLAERGLVRCIHVERGERPESPCAYGGVLITGSSAMVSDRLPWSEAAAGWLRDAMDVELPVFGVCYGHQLLAHALGGGVEDHPAGQELGTHEIFLHAQASQESVLEGVPPRFMANLFHSQTVLALPRTASVLAGSAHDPHQILRYGPMVWSTQFHPEFDSEIMRAIVERERKHGNPAASRTVVEEAFHARTILRRFVERVA